MGIKLDWEVEAESDYAQEAREDRLSVRGRWLARLRLILGVLIVVGIFGGIGGVLWWRLQTVDGEIRRALEDTVAAEVTSLRLADRVGYLDVQRSADDVWRNTQSEQFDVYQTLKQQYDVQLTGEVVNIEVDGARGRVQVQEIIDGIPYVQTWFYWRYGEDGWRHVPPDYTFWGETQTQTQGNLTVRYRDVDEPLAIALVTEGDVWLTQTCAVLGCATVPEVEIEIVAQPGIGADWNVETPWQMVVPSVYVGRSRLDRPFDTALRLRVADLLVSRLAEQAATVPTAPYPSDALYVREAVKSWLTGQFAQTGTGSYLIDSYVARYGQESLQTAISNLQPDANLTLLAAAAGVASVDSLEVDWRDYLTWRLNAEADLNTQRDQAGFNALYDFADPVAANIATVRFAQPAVPERREVVRVQSGADGQGTPLLQATVAVGEGDAIRQEAVTFRLVEGSWRRIN